MVLLQCTNILVPNEDLNNFQLVEAPVPTAEGRRLDQLIPEFFSCGKYGIRIAVACGSDFVWSSEEFAQVLKRCAVNSRKDRVFSWKTERRDSVCTGSIYATTNDNPGTEVDGVMSIFHGSVRDICLGIMEKTTDKASKAKEKIQTACTQLENLKDCPCLRGITDKFAKSISESFSSDDVVCGFPTVMILFFLPELAFEGFKDQNAHFFKQIEYVLLFESEDRLKREEAEARASRLSQELESTRSELEKIKKQLQTEISDGRRKELETLLNEKERKIAELATFLTSTKQEIDRLQSNLAAEQSKNAELERRLASEVTKNKELETVLMQVSCFNYNLDLRILTQNHNGYSNETEMKETAMMDPQYSKYLGRLAGKEGRKSMVATEMEMYFAIQDSDLDEQTAVDDLEKTAQIAKNPDRTRNMVGFIDKDDRQSRKEEGRER